MKYNYKVEESKHIAIFFCMQYFSSSSDTETTVWVESDDMIQREVTWFEANPHIILIVMF